MKKSADRRIIKLAEQLENADIDQETINRIMEGGEPIGKSAQPEKIADWFRGAMMKMDKLLDKEVRYALREGCACSLGGQKLRAATKIAQENDTLEERIKAVNAKHYICGSNVTLEKNGELLVCGDTEGRYGNKCVCLPDAKEPLPITYCYCCAGHFKHHLQIALDRKLECTVVSSPLNSGDKYPCTFRFRIIE